MAEKDGFDPNLWKPRSVAETQAIYDDWAARYDADLAQSGYETPGRVAEMLAATDLDRAAPILDYGCGTGLSGLALRAAGFRHLDGTDINAAMLAEARGKSVYTKLWQSAPGARPPEGYAAITAAGVISLGAAPPETLALLLGALAPGGYLALSFNDATLADPSYTDAMAAALAGPATRITEAYGVHLRSKDMGSTVTLLRRR